MVQISATDRNSIVLEGCEALLEHLAASGGQLFLKEVFINFVVRLGKDRECEEVEKGTVQ